MNAFSGLQPILTFLMLGAVSAGALSNLWIWFHRRHDMESYISEHSHATFSHGICPDCRNMVVAREVEQWRRAR